MIRARLIALAAGMALATSACGKGLFTTSGFVQVPADAGNDTDGAIYVPPPGDGPISPDRTAPPDLAGSRDLVVSPDLAVFPDLVVSSDRPASPDQHPPPDAPGSDSSTTQVVDSRGSDLVLGDATLTLPKGAFADSPSAIVTLALEGTVATWGYPGPVGPIFSITKNAILAIPATLSIHFKPDSSIPTARVELAYLDTLAAPNLWIPFNSSYDTATGTVTGTVVDFSGTRVFAPVESCSAILTCSGTLTCQGGACQ